MIPPNHPNIRRLLRRHRDGMTTTLLLATSAAMPRLKFIVAVDDDMADGKWTWDAHANVEPYILISHAESGNSVEGASNVGPSGEGEGLWPHAAD